MVARNSLAPSAPDLDRARGLARVLDTAVRIPGTNVHFGLDAILGLIPGVGDAAGALFSGYLVLLATRAGAPRAVILRMLLNVGVDAVLGVVPVVGDLFDVAFKASTRNLALLERYTETPMQAKAASRTVVWFAAGVVGAIVVLAIAGVVLLVQSLF